MTDRETWLSTIRSNPSDWQAMLVFADWLEEEGDLLAAEQWRFISVCCGAAWWMDKCKLPNFVAGWPFQNGTVDHASFERGFAAENNIRCMSTYPLTIEDVHAYFSQLESIDSR